MEILVKDNYNYKSMLNKTYFCLPKVENLVINPTRGDKNIVLEKLGYSFRLNDTKNKISKISQVRWALLRKKTNSLEYPYKATLIKKPASRAFFKLLEIIKDLELNVKGVTLHLAEAPGGFIQATRYLKKDKETSYTFSLIGDEDRPLYKKEVIEDKNVILLSNKKNNGDLCDYKNIEYLELFFKDKNVNFITCDGGITENKDFSFKEQIHHHLIYNEIYTSLVILQERGDLVVKIFDIFTELTFDYLYLLGFLFKDVYISKPNTSRPTNSEKYIVCKNYQKYKFKELKPILQEVLRRGVVNFKSIVKKQNIQKNFVDTLNCITKYLSEYQIFNIETILKIEELNLSANSSSEELERWVSKYYN